MVGTAGTLYVVMIQDGNFYLGVGAGFRPVHREAAGMFLGVDSDNVRVEFSSLGRHVLTRNLQEFDLEVRVTQFATELDASAIKFQMVCVFFNVSVALTAWV